MTNRTFLPNNSKEILLMLESMDSFKSTNLLVIHKIVPTFIICTVYVKKYGNRNDIVKITHDFTPFHPLYLLRATWIFFPTCTVCSSRMYRISLSFYLDEKAPRLSVKAFISTW